MFCALISNSFWQSGYSVTLDFNFSERQGFDSQRMWQWLKERRKQRVTWNVISAWEGGRGAMILHTLKDGWTAPLVDQKFLELSLKKKGTRIGSILSLVVQTKSWKIFNIYSWCVFHLLKVMSEVHLENKWKNSICNTLCEMAIPSFVFSTLPLGVLCIKLSWVYNSCTEPQSSRAWHLL